MHHSRRCYAAVASTGREEAEMTKNSELSAEAATELPQPGRSAGGLHRSSTRPKLRAALIRTFWSSAKAFWSVSSSSASGLATTAR